MARSTDGGETFTNFLVSEEPFNPVSAVFFGDYTNIVAHNDVIRPIWTRLHNNQTTIWTAIVDPTAVGIEEYPAGGSPVSMEQSYPNPFAGSTVFSFKIHKAATVRLSVSDAVGRQVAVLADDIFLDPGKYTYQFDASGKNLASGVYYFILVTNENVTRKKVILAR